MILNADKLKEIAEEVNKPWRKNARYKDYERFLMFNGATEGIIRDAISKEFEKPETVEGLMSRLVPINLVNKIVVKRSGVYTQSPMRTTKDKSATDQELMDLFTDKMCLDQRMKEANRYFKLFKRNLMEVYTDDAGNPCARNLPRHTYEVFSFSAVTPNRPDVVVKILKDGATSGDQVFAIWSDDSHFMTDGDGQIIVPMMIEMDNPFGLNPFDVLPFVYTNESSHSVDPIPDDDLIRLAIAIPILLTDLCFAIKYQAWSMIYTVGAPGDIPMNPNSVIEMAFGPNGEVPQIGQIKPEVDTDKVLLLVQTLVALLLSTNSLSVATVQAKLETSNAASGISKMLDSAESVEDKKDQQEHFEKTEKWLWNLIAKQLLPIWRFQGKIAPELNRAFSENFEMDIFFSDPKVLITESEQIDISKKRLDAGFSTLEMELKNIYPQLDEAQILDLKQDIEDEGDDKVQREIKNGDRPPLKLVENDNSRPAQTSKEEFQDVRKETLNGAQITAVVEMVQLVAAGLMPRDAAKNILITGFNLDDSEAEKMLGKAGAGFRISKEEVSPKREPA